MAVKEILYKEKQYNISYEIHNTQNMQRDVLFLHGWGSNKEVMKTAFKNFLKDYRHFYIDMPGFGNSNNNSILCTQDYASIVEIFLSLCNISLDRVLVVGHSFGGKIAVLLKVKKIVLLSSAGIVPPKKAITKLKIVCAKICNFIGINSSYFRSKDVEGMPSCMYETFKCVVNEDFTNYFKQCNAHVLILWGQHDTITPLECGKMIATLIPYNEFISFEGDHYFFINQAQQISDRIQQKFYDK